MKPDLVKALIALYPRKWRERYGDEFSRMLEDQAITIRAIFDIIVCALYARVCLLGVNLMKEVKSSLTLILFAGVATLAAGANLFFTVDDSPLATAMQAHSTLAACWLVMAAGSVLSVAGLAVASLPIFWAMVRFAWGHRRMDIGLRLFFAPVAFFLALLWIVGVVACTHWAPLPWAVTGDWPAPANWPLLKVRWELCWVTLALLAFGVIGSAMSLRNAMALIESAPRTTAPTSFKWPSLHRMRTFAFVVFVATICTMAGAAVGGVLADSYSPNLSHARLGFVATTASVSWLVSIGLLATAAAAALVSFRCAGSSRTETIQ